MSTSSPTKTPARQRNRQRIVDAALELWMRHPESSMDDIATAARVVRRTLYSHFHTREDLIIAVAARAAEFIDDPAHEIAADDDPAVRLVQLSMRLWAFGHHMRVLIAAAGHADPAAIAAIRGRITAATTTIIADGQATGQFRNRLPPQVIASLLESAAVVLHDAAAGSRWEISQRDVAANALITAGVDAKTARDLTRHLARE